MQPRQTKSRVPQPPKRRHRNSTAGPGTVALAAGLDIARTAHAAGSDLVRIGLIGCGGRGPGARCRPTIARAPEAGWLPTGPRTSASRVWRRRVDRTAWTPPSSAGL